MSEKVDVFIVGAQKAGTTSLYDWLSQHPEISAPAEIKDYHFFTNEKIYKKGFRHLESFYPNDEKIRLHAGVNYMFFSDLGPRRIYEYNPRAKVIICLRNPVDRAISAYKYFRKTLREGCSFDQALKSEIDNELESFEGVSNNSYIAHGHYLSQIERILDYFPRSSIFFAYFEDIIDGECRGVTMAELLLFLNVRETNFAFDFKHLNNSGKPHSLLVNWFIRRSFVAKILGLLLPKRLKHVLKTRIDTMNTGNEKIPVKIHEKDIAFLRGIYRGEVMSLSRVLDRDVNSLWGL